MDENFIYVYTEDTLYTIARTTGDWGYIKVGDYVNGIALTQRTLDSWKSECEKEDTFVLK